MTNELNDAVNAFLSGDRRSMNSIAQTGVRPSEMGVIFDIAAQYRVTARSLKVAIHAACLAEAAQ